MTLYEKITELRKRSGLSQEELGARIGVSRQAVSKWEMAQTTPDLNKIIAMAELFGVSTDFLLREKYDLSFLALDPERSAVSEPTGTVAGEATGVLAGEADARRFIGLEEIQEYLNVRAYAARNYVLSCFLFFMSPFAGLFLLLFDEKKAIIGSVVQVLVLITVVVMTALTLSKLTAFKYLKNEDTELAYGVRGIIEKKREEFQHTRLMGIVIGLICMIGSVIPMMILSAFTSYNDVAVVICGCLMLLIFAAGVSSILYVQCIDGGYKKIRKMR